MVTEFNQPKTYVDPSSFIASRTRSKLGSRVVRYRPVQYPSEWFIRKARIRKRKSDTSVNASVRSTKSSKCCQISTRKRVMNQRSQSNTSSVVKRRKTTSNQENDKTKKNDKKRGKKKRKTMTEVHHQCLRPDTDGRCPIPQPPSVSYQVHDMSPLKSVSFIKRKQIDHHDEENECPFTSRVWDQDCFLDLQARPVDERNKVSNMDDPELDRTQRRTRIVTVKRHRVKDNPAARRKIRQGRKHRMFLLRQKKEMKGKAYRRKYLDKRKEISRKLRTPNKKLKRNTTVRNRKTANAGLLSQRKRKLELVRNRKIASNIKRRQSNVNVIKKRLSKDRRTLSRGKIERKHGSVKKFKKITHRNKKR